MTRSRYSARLLAKCNEAVAAGVPSRRPLSLKQYFADVNERARYVPREVQPTHEQLSGVGRHDHLTGPLAGTTSYWWHCTRCNAHGEMTPCRQEAQRGLDAHLRGES